MNTLLTQDAVTPPAHSTREIPLTQGKVAIVDAADYEWLMQWKWHAIHPNPKGEHWYAVRQDKIRGTVYMHRELSTPRPGMVVDHIDRNGLNNSRSNLRAVTQSANLLNRKIQKTNISGYRGVAWDSTQRMWRVSLNVDGKTKHLGRFRSKAEAVKTVEAYLKVNTTRSLKFHGNGK